MGVAARRAGVRRTGERCSDFWGKTSLECSEDFSFKSNLPLLDIRRSSPLVMMSIPRVSWAQARGL